MYDTLMEIVKDRVDERIEKVIDETLERATLADIRRAMRKQSMSLEEALEYSDIAMEDRPRYIALMNEASDKVNYTP